jgi:hypothetical protein
MLQAIKVATFLSGVTLLAHRRSVARKVDVRLQMRGDKREWQNSSSGFRCFDLVVAPAPAEEVDVRYRGSLSLDALS